MGLLTLSVYDIDFADTLIKNYKMDINAKNGHGLTILHVAIRSKVYRMLGGEDLKKTVKFLLSKGASLEVKDNWGHTPLHLAAGLGSGCEDVVAMLIQAGAKLNAKDHRGKTPLQNTEERNASLKETYSSEEPFDITQAYGCMVAVGGRVLSSHSREPLYCAETSSTGAVVPVKWADQVARSNEVQVSL